MGTWIALAYLAAGVAFYFWMLRTAEKVEEPSAEIIDLRSLRKAAPEAASDADDEQRAA